MAQGKGGIESEYSSNETVWRATENLVKLSRIAAKGLNRIHPDEAVTGQSVLGTPNIERVTIEKGGTQYTGRRVIDTDGPEYVGYSKSEPEGIVILVWPDGSTYEYKGVAGQPNGRGVYTWPDGTQFHSPGRKVGETIEKGTLIFPNGNRWDCEAVFSDGLDALSLVNEEYGCTVKFPQGLPHGEVTYLDGSVWSVEFTHGLTKGILKYLDGTKYEGELEGFQPSGSGVYEWQDGTEYRGNWILGRIEGEGIMIWTDKAIYKGQWVDGKKQGKGIYIWPDQLTYEGQWHEDKLVRGGNLQRGGWETNPG